MCPRAAALDAPAALGAAVLAEVVIPAAQAQTPSVNRITSAQRTYYVQWLVWDPNNPTVLPTLTKGAEIKY